MDPVIQGLINEATSLLTNRPENRTKKEYERMYKKVLTWNTKTCNVRKEAWATPEQNDVSLKAFKEIDNKIGPYAAYLMTMVHRYPY